jgi:hypothetical protein
MQQLGVQNSFLPRFLKEGIYMRQPLGYDNKTLPQYVCKLDKSLYGLKQEPRAWYARLSSKHLELGLKILKADNSLFDFRNGDVTMFILVYVSNIIVTSSKTPVVTTLLKNLGDDFALKDLGDMHYFLGIKVNKVNDDIILSQDKYANDLLKRAGMTMCKPVNTPLATGAKLASYIGTPLGKKDSTQYRSIVGAL